MEDSPVATRIVVEWLALHTRITAFHPDEIVFTNLTNWWQNTFDEQPARTESKPRENSELVSGRVSHWQLTANARPGRTDFVLEPNGEVNTESNPVWPVPATGTYRQTMEELAIPVEGWLKVVPQVYRLAVGALLLSPGPGLDAVHSTLSSFLPEVKLNGLSTPDFIFRVNRVRSATNISGVAINRLATWSIAQGQSVAISPNRAEPEAGPVQYAAHLELDINTRTEPNSAFTTAATPAIFKQLMDMAIEIAEQGDTP